MILITGCCGFIGFHLANQINSKVIGIDNLNDYYDTKLKKKRLEILKSKKNFTFLKIDLKNKKKLLEVFLKYKIKCVINLAAQPGVRVSYAKPYKTLSENILTFINIIECSRIFKVKRFIYASSSSVYGDTKRLPFHEDDKNINPISIYGASKLSNEIIAKSFSTNFNMQCIGLRFFTVYGPYGRPDMAYFKFLLKNKENKKINIYNMGRMLRDFTYIDDIILAIKKIINKKIIDKNIILNVGKGKPDKLDDLIFFLQKFGQINFKKNFINSFPAGDVKKTFSSNIKIKKLLGWNPNTSLKKGIEKFCKWYKNFYN